MQLSNPPVDYFIVGTGNYQPEYEMTRHNVGFIFIDYITNAIAVEKQNVQPGQQKLPIFFMRYDLNACIHDITYQITPDKKLRLVFIKPTTGMNDSGIAVEKILSYYGYTDLSKQLIVVFDDLNSLPGSLLIQNGGDLGAVKGHKGVESIAKCIKTNDFYRFRIGIGRPPSSVKMSIPDFVLGKFTSEKNEINLIGHALGLTSQALLALAKTPNDLKNIRKKYCKVSKIPRNLTPMNSLIFPIDLHGY